jgi:uncharacterized protein
MTTLKDRLRADMNQARKDGDELRKTTLGYVLGQIETREKSSKTPVELNHQEVEVLLRKESATRRDTARTMADADEPGRAERENAEADVIDAYLPKMLTEDDVAAIVDKVITELTEQNGEAPGARQMGQVMKPVQAKVAGRFNGKQVSQMVKERLA